MLKTHFHENNFPPNLSRFEFEFTADIDRKIFGKDREHLYSIAASQYLVVAKMSYIPFINNAEVSHV